MDVSCVIYPKPKFVLATAYDIPTLKTEFPKILCQQLIVHQIVATMSTVYRDRQYDLFSKH